MVIIMHLISLKYMYLKSPGAANLTARDTLSLGAHRRPLSESLSAPGFQQQQSASGGASAEFNQQYESLLRQFNVQNQQLLLQGHLLQQQYLEQQQRYLDLTTITFLV